jgi:multidrug efflux pump subunit AcrB
MTIAATILGIIVDDTVHTLHRLKLRLAAGDTIQVALQDAAHTAGAANFASNVVLIVGFSILAFASVKTMSYVGLLSAIAIFGALLADMVLVPPLAWVLFAQKPGAQRPGARGQGSTAGPASLLRAPRCPLASSRVCACISPSASPSGRAS